MSITTSSKPIFVIRPREESGITAKPRLVRAARASNAQSYLLQAFTVEKCSVEEALQLGADGVTVEDADS